MKIWQAAQSRPDGYPEGLPFVPGTEVAVESDRHGDPAEGASGEVVVMKWWAVPRPLELLQQLLGACVTEGWVLHEDNPPTANGDPGSVRTLHLHRAGRERVVEAVQANPFSFVTLKERDLR
jgi:hypothetical protein